ncbi:MAG: hypothetical protein NTW86_30480 [Candidatus Sumerlaeota bacterium]|nr:hypothetical protein [Candidatus Sumerlaeota bacterium]
MWEESREESPAFVLAAWGVVAALLVGFAIAARLVFPAKSAGFAELEQIGAGWAFRKTGDSTLNAKEPPFGRFLLAAPVQVSSATPPQSLAGVKDRDALAIGGEILSGVYGRQRLYAARWVSLLFAGAMGLGVFRWSARLWGPFGGLFSLAFFVFSPAMLGFASLATADMAASTLAFYALYWFWRSHRDPSLTRVLLVALAAAGAAASRYLGAGTFVLLAGLSLLGVFFGEGYYPLFDPGDRVEPRALWALTVWNYVAALAICLGVGWLFLSAIRGFEFSPDWYFDGLRAAMSGGAGGRPVFFDGEYSLGGFVFAPFWAFWFRTPVPALIAALLGFGCVRRGRFYDASYLIAAGALTLIGAMAAGRTGHLNELLLVYPILFILAGAIFQTPLFPHAPHVVAGAAGLLWLIVSAWRASPDYLAYGNFMGGGCDGVSRRFDAWNGDRGRDVPALRDALSEARADGATVYLPSLGQPAELLGRGVRNLAEKPEEIYFPSPGVYVVGLGDLQTPALFGLQDYRFYWLKDFRPQRRLGSDLYLFQFEAAEGRPFGYDPRSGVNRIDPASLWDLNRPRLDALLAGAPNDPRAQHARAFGLYSHGMALLKAGERQLAVERFLEARRGNTLTKEENLALSIGLAKAYQALGREDGLKEEIAAIRELAPDSPALDELLPPSARRPRASRPASPSPPEAGVILPEEEPLPAAPEPADAVEETPGAGAANEEAAEP